MCSCAARMIQSDNNMLRWGLVTIGLGLGSAYLISKLRDIKFIQALPVDVAEEPAQGQQENEEEATQPAKRSVWEELEDEQEHEGEIPAEYRDPISLGPIYDPVILCATGHVYDYSTIRTWFSAGNRICPKSNIEVLDAQVVRVPWLKSQIHSWMHKHDIEIPPPEDNMPEIAALDANLPNLITQLRSHTEDVRSRAMFNLFELFKSVEHGAHNHLSQEKLVVVREEIMDDLIWCMRYNNKYQQGLAASILAYCDSPEECGWLAACATAPAVAIILSPDHYTSQAACRVLYNIACAGDKAKSDIIRLGGVSSLLHILSQERQEYGYSRDRALATLNLLIAHDPEVRREVMRTALPWLLRIVKQDTDRWEKRDASSALLKLKLPQEMLGGVTLRQLLEWWWGSRAWLSGTVPSPTEGYTEAESRCKAITSQLEKYEQYLPMLIAANRLSLLIEAARGRNIRFETLHEQADRDDEDGDEDDDEEQDEEDLDDHEEDEQDDQEHDEEQQDEDDDEDAAYEDDDHARDGDGDYDEGQQQEG